MADDDKPRTTRRDYILGFCDRAWRSDAARVLDAFERGEPPPPAKPDSERNK